MDSAFRQDSGLSDKQMEPIEALYTQIEASPLHTKLLRVAIEALMKQDNRSLYESFDVGYNTFGALYPLVLTRSLYPGVLALYSTLGINDSVRKATISDIAIWVNHYEQAHSHAVGLDRYGWISRLLCAQVLRLGRLQYEPTPFPFPYSIYLDTTTKDIRAFTLADIEYHDETGEVCITRHDIQGGYCITHEVDQERGVILPQPRILSLSHLQLLTRQGKDALAIHIPEGQPLTPDLVDESLSMAQETFGPMPYICSSWLLDPNLEKILPQQGNIVQFMHRFNKLPITFTVPQIYERVFGFGVTHSDILKWECTTSLQQKVRDHLLAGGTFSTMGGYIPKTVEI